MKTQNRLQITDTTLSAIQKMSGGNPGAMTALLKLMEASPAVDPDSALGEITPLLSLDSWGIYESRIWMLYKDVCNQYAPFALACLRAVQLGLLTEGKLHHAIDNRGDGLNVNQVLADVQARLPKFAANLEITTTA